MSSITSRTDLCRGNFPACAPIRPTRRTGGLPLALFAASLFAGVLPQSRAQLVSAIGTFTSDAGAFDLISLNSSDGATFNQVSDTAGPVAVNGAFAVDNNATTLVSMSAAPAGPSLYVTGQLSITSGQTVQLNNGYASLPGAAGWAWSGSGSKDLQKTGQGTLHYNSSSTQNPLTANPAWNWSTLLTQFEGASTALANAASSNVGAISIDGGGNLVLTPPAGVTSGVVVFNFDASKLSGNKYNGSTIQNFAVNVPNKNYVYVINVINLKSGTSFLSGINVNAGSNDGQVLWNFNSATDGNFTFANGGDIYGSVLAPDLVVTSDTYQEGQVVAAGLTQNKDEFDGKDQITNIPEPSGSAVCAGAFALFAVAALGRRGAVQKRWAA